MGQTFDNESKGKAIARGTLNAAAGGFNAASGVQPSQPVDFSGIGTAVKRARSPRPFTMNNPTTGVIPKPPSDVAPNLNVPIFSPMPDLYSGTNAQIPQLRKPINGMLPFYGQ